MADTANRTKGKQQVDKAPHQGAAVHADCFSGLYAPSPTLLGMTYHLIDKNVCSSLFQTFHITTKIQKQRLIFLNLIDFLIKEKTDVRKRQHTLY
ncbi:MAG: hypothetical protein IKV52_04300 [Oscillospiraceae bacterium]|nr:hypothetical protein [Oscillospiraceae bacterium]